MATKKRSNLFIISLLGSLSVVSPFSIDMYLTGYDSIAQKFGVESSKISLTLSSYFIGLALGQVVYGPLLDRFGRKRPLAFGLGLFIVPSIGCAFSPSLNVLIALRFVQGLGGCVAQVASIAMVRDFFPVKDCAKVLSLLFLFIAASPLFAPIVGNWLIGEFGWEAVFYSLAVVVASILALVYFTLPEGHIPDPDISLRPGPIVTEYYAILSNPRFATYAIAGAFAFAGLFTYVAGSPIIFKNGFGVDDLNFSKIFALLACGFIGSSQMNVLLLRRFRSESLFLFFLCIQVATGLLFFLAFYQGWLGLIGTIAFLLVFLSCVGLINPNGSALAMGPFTKNAGSASALMGFFQLGFGAVISTGVGAASANDSRPIVGILAATAVIALAVLLLGRNRAARSPLSELPTKTATEAEMAPEAAYFGH